MLPKRSIIPVAGVTFHKDAVKATQVGDKVTLVHTPDNQYDGYAVEISVVGVGVVGFVPASLNRRFSDPGSGGIVGGEWEGVVEEKLRHEDVEGLRIRLV